MKIFILYDSNYCLFGIDTTKRIRVFSIIPGNN
jgi:hypothetical protein